MMKHTMHKLILPLLLVTLCLPLSGCLGSDPLAEGDELDGLVGAEGLSDAEEPMQNTPAPLTSFALPILTNDTLNPFSCGDGIQQTILPLLYEGLFELNEAFEPQKLLCSEYASSPDFMIWTFTLRSGASFSDGSAVTATDVAASLQRAKSSVRYVARLSAVTSIKADGANKVVITLNKANNRLPALLNIPILSKASLDAAFPIGSGPYYYKATENETACLVKNSHWPESAALQLDTIHLEKIADESILPYLFSSHAVQMLVTDYTGNAPVSYKGNLSVTDALSTDMHYLGFNCANGPFSNPALRKAVSLGLYRDNLCKAYFSSHMQSAEFPVAPTAPWYPKELEQGYSSELFAKSMAEAGYNSGHRKTVHMLVCDGNTFRISAAKAIAASLSAYDLNVIVKILPYSDYVAALQKGSFDLYYGEVRMTPDFNCSALLETGGALNYGRFSDPALDEKMNAAFSVGENAGSANKAMLTAFQSQAPIAVIGFKSQSVVLQGGAVDSITPTCANPFYQLSHWKIHIKGEPTNG